MTYARKSLVSLGETPYYHVVARCVRRAWLWGFDEYAGCDYSHRKEWVLERLAQLTSVFAIDICAYAVMSDHYHLVVHVDQHEAKRLTGKEVVERWTQLFAAPESVARWLAGDGSPSEIELAESIIGIWRARLHDLSWFMKCLNEHLARRANAEDNRTGRFWEGRFKSQALLDEQGLLTAMVYVDLNPIRAGIAATPEESQFTSIFERIRELRGTVSAPPDGTPTAKAPLRPFRARADQPDALPYRLEDYLELVDWSGRRVRPDKRGFIDSRLPPILERLTIDSHAWQVAMRPRGNAFGRALGRVERLRLHAQALGQCWIRGIRQARGLYAR